MASSFLDPAPRAFLMRLPLITDQATEDKILAWGKANFVWFRIKEFPEDDCIEAGGLFDSRPPKDLRGFQSRVLMNLKSWKVDRKNVRYERGWLRFVTPGQCQNCVRPAGEARRHCEEILQDILQKTFQEVRQRQIARDARLERAVGLLAALTNKRAEPGFKAVGAAIFQRRATREAALAEKTQLFNEQRFGKEAMEQQDTPLKQVGYSEKELDDCSSWTCVKRRRLANPPGRDRELEDRCWIERTKQQRTLLLCEAMRNNARG